jgi:hypothetical protein
MPDDSMKGARVATEQASGARTRDPLDEILSRLVPIHAALAERPDGDPELQRWTRQRLMEVIEYIGDLMDVDPAAPS